MSSFFLTTSSLYATGEAITSIKLQFLAGMCDRSCVLKTKTKPKKPHATLVLFYKALKLADTKEGRQGSEILQFSGLQTFMLTDYLKEILENIHMFLDWHKKFCHKFK